LSAQGLEDDSEAPPGLEPSRQSTSSAVSPARAGEHGPELGRRRAIAPAGPPGPRQRASAVDSKRTAPERLARARAVESARSRRSSMDREIDADAGAPRRAGASIPPRPGNRAGGGEEHGGGAILRAAERNRKKRRDRQRRSGRRAAAQREGNLTRRRSEPEESSVAEAKHGDEPGTNGKRGDERGDAFELPTRKKPSQGRRRGNSAHAPRPGKPGGRAMRSQRGEPQIRNRLQHAGSRGWRKPSRW